MYLLPRDIITANLIALGFTQEAIINADGTLSINALSKLSALPYGRDVAKSVKKAYNRFSGSPIADLNKLVFDSAVGASTPHMLEALPDEVTIEWVASSASQPDSYHAKFYGKRMTMKEAKAKGWGGGKDRFGRTHWGCQCGAKIIKPSQIKTIKKAVKL